MSAPSVMAPSFLPSSSARELTVDNGTPSTSAYARATVRSCSMPDMGSISVSLPGKSTAILPDAQPFDSGHSTGMELAAILHRIERRLRVLGLSADDASKQAGVPDAIRNIRRAVESGKGGMAVKTLVALAPVLETKPCWLLGDQEQAPIDELGLEALEQKRDELLEQVGKVQVAITARTQQKAPQKRGRKKTR